MDEMERPDQRFLARDSGTGQFVSHDAAEADPEGTQTERVTVKSPWRKEAERLLDVIESMPGTHEYFVAAVNLQTHCRVLER